MDSGNERAGAVVTRSPRLAAILLAAVASAGCLVVALHPAHDDAGIVWEPSLVGTWVNEDDRVTATIGRGEWKSYRIDYEHPIEKGTLTGYLTTVGDRQYLDLSPVRGEDHGSFLLPVHAVVRIDRTADTISVQALDYDRFFDAAKKGGLPALGLTIDQKQNVVVAAPTPGFRKWLRTDAVEAWFGARAVFKRKVSAAAPAAGSVRSARPTTGS
jgi:hypothetical protein